MSDSNSALYKETWFEPFFVTMCIVFLILLFFTAMPDIYINANVAKTLAMGRLISEGRVWDAFSKFNIPPAQPLILAAIIKLRRTTDLMQLVEIFRISNLIYISGFIVTTYIFLKRHLEKPFTFIITGLVVLAASTVEMIWVLDSQALFALSSMLTLLVVDISLSQESALGGYLSKRELILCGSLLGFTILCWQVGYLLLFGFFIVCWRRFGFQRGLLILSTILLCIGPFIGRDVYGVIRRPQELTAPSVEIIQHISRHNIFNTMQYYVDNVTGKLVKTTMDEVILDPFAQSPNHKHRSHKTTIMNNPWIRWTISLVALVGAFYGLKKYTGLGSIYLSVYVISTLLLLPKKINPGIAPVLPLLLFYLYYGLLFTGEWMKKIELPLLAKILPPCITVWILLSSVSHHIDIARQGYPLYRKRVGISHVIYLSTAKTAKNKLEAGQKNTAHRKLQRWLTRNLPADGRPIPKQIPDASVLTLTRKVSAHDYLVLESHHKIKEQKKRAFKGLKMVYEDAVGRIQVWRINRSTS